MNRKSYYGLLLILIVLVIGTIVGCAQKSPADNNDINDMEPATKPTSSNSDPEKPSDPSGNTPSVKMSEITKIYWGYSEGKCFVQTASGIHCIDKKGQIIFTLSQGYYPMNYPICNGLAIVTKEPDNQVDPISYLCKPDGTIVSAEDLNATKLVLAPGTLASNPAEEKMFVEGYFLALNKTDETVAIFDSTLEPVFSYSKELYTALDGCSKYSTYSSVDYYGGFIFTAKSKNNRWIDIEAGTINENGQQYLETIQPKYASDFWRYNNDDNYFYDYRFSKSYGKPEVALDLSSINIYTRYYSQWYSGKILIIEQRQGAYSYAILDEKGNVISSGYSGSEYSADGEYAVFVVQENNHEITAIVVDFNGNVITNKVLNHDGSIFTTYISTKITDGVITLPNENKFVTLDFELLF